LPKSVKGGFMTNKQSCAMVDRLRAIFPNGERFFADKQRLVEYSQEFAQMEYAFCEKAINSLKRKLAFMPSIAELWQEYEAVNPRVTQNIENSEPCHVCSNNGFVVIIKKMANGDKTLEYPTILHCDKCQKGQEYRYDGREVTKNKSKYFVEPISQYYDTHMLEAKRVFGDDVDEVSLRRVKHMMKEVQDVPIP
jgi:hypothetical protein